MTYKPPKWVLETLLENMVIGRKNGKSSILSPYNLILKDLKERYENDR